MTDINRRLFLIAALCSALMTGTSLANAKDSDAGGESDDNDSDDHDDEGDNSGSSHDQDRARRAVSKGDAVPLRKLKSFLTVNYPGKIVKIKLDKKNKILVYRVRILQAGNRLRSLTLDAKTLHRLQF